MLQRQIIEEAEKFIQQGHERFLQERKYKNGFVFINQNKDDGTLDWDTIKVFISDSNKRKFFRDLRDTINLHLEGEGIEINIDIEEEKLEYSFNVWLREQPDNQRNLPSVTLSLAPQDPIEQQHLDDEGG